MRYFQEAEFKLMINKLFVGKDSGLTLAEALVGMTIFLITLAFMIPLLANNQLNTINREIETGAISASQRILDEFRQSLDDLPANEWATKLPLSGTETKLPLPYPSGTDISSITELGKKYSAKIIYCEFVSPATTNPNCDANTRQIKLQVNYNGQTIYTVETVYTRFQ